MSQGVYISKRVAVATVTVTVIALVSVIAMVIYHRVRTEECPPSPLPTVVTPTSVPTKPPTNIWLPGNLVPESYRIYLQTHLQTRDIGIHNQNLNFSGNSTVKFLCVEATDWIVIHSKDLSVTVKGVRDGRGRAVPVKGFQEQNDTDTIQIELSDTLRVGRMYYLTTEFEGVYHNSSGMFMRGYKENGTEERYVVASHMEPTDARRVFPCFDEPAMKAVFTVSIIHRKGTIALSNMAQKDQVEKEIDGEAWLITEFYPTVKMSTYLIAFVVSNFEYKETNYGRYTLKTWARPEAIAGGFVNYAHSIAGDIIDFFEEFCGIEYPLNKIDQIAVPKLKVGGMENWGLIVYEEETFLYDARLSTTLHKELLASVVAHELAHQWFGNLVTMSWWNEVWLKEGFSTFLSYLALDKVEPTWNTKDLIVVHEIQGMLHLDSEDIFHPLSLGEEDIQSVSDITDLYGSIVYNKGAAVLRMLADLLSMSVFEKGVQSYLKAFQYKSAYSEDLWIHFQKAVNDSGGNIAVAEVMTTWTDQSGYPVVTIDTKSGEVSQKHFLLHQESEYNLTWQVPIKLMKSGSGDITFDLLTVLGPVSKPLYQADANEWILANINQTGYYRVNYDPENWEKLLQQLETDHRKIPVITRGQLIDDAFSLARAKHVNITLALRTTKYLLNDTEYIPWSSALTNLQYVVSMFDRSEVYGPVKAYLRKLVGPLYDHFESFTMNSTIPDSHSAQYTHNYAAKFACASDLQKCRNMAIGLFDRWRRDPATNPIHSNLKLTVYCSAVAAGGEEEWDFVWKMFQKAPIMLEKHWLRLALACTKDVWILNRYLEYSLDADKISPEDCVSTINAVAKNVVGQPLAWNFVRSRWSDISQKSQEMISQDELIEGVTERFSTAFELEQLWMFHEEHLNDLSISGKRALTDALERTQKNMEWVTENKRTLLEWFRREVSQESNS
ncbi:aminopeptidase Ey-like [Megalops cyprinoides]|uniref:aminopeptidase Ey-like n=1 Tax=Megalops cyprinoides TaxID=118141 RepID=UPI0018653617|nr:aminopeptidase Ey-like [Megalops cyprinoides]